MERAMGTVQQSFVTVDREVCKGCSLCVVTCPMKNFTLSDSLNRNGYHPAEFHYHGEKGDCTACGICYWVCPDFAVAEIRRLKR
ncbi:MAG: ferredoxin family protein [Thaumarchaeota archaeon]|nr:ferredoxin family protein [Nitrososphaerota archaeon]